MRGKNTLGRVGEFYQLLLAQVLEAEISPFGDREYADIFNRRLGFRVEVKSRGQNNSVGIGIDQKRFYESWGSLPESISQTLYGIVLYRNRGWISSKDKIPRGFSKKTTMISLLKGLHSKFEQQSFWSKNISVIYLLDLEIMNSLERILQTRKGLFAGRPEENCIVIPRKTLTRLFIDESLGRTLRELELTPSSFAKGVYPISTVIKVGENEFPSEFTLVTVLRRSLHAKIATLLSTKPLELMK